MRLFSFPLFLLQLLLCISISISLSLVLHAEKWWAIPRPLLFFIFAFSIQPTVICLMTGFEPLLTSGVGSDRSTNSATTTALGLLHFCTFLRFYLPHQLEKLSLQCVHLPCSVILFHYTCCCPGPFSVTRLGDF